MTPAPAAILWLLQEAEPPVLGLVLAMLLSLSLCLTGMLVAYLAWRRRRQPASRDEEKSP